MRGLKRSYHSRKDVLKMDKFLDVNAVMLLLKCKQSTAYKVMRRLNGELKENGFLVKPGIVPRKYIMERFGL